jgi:hypothetical protein
MEITSQLANLEDEVKLLKGEIKSILKETRAAILASDNPFTSGGAAPLPGGAAPSPELPAASGPFASFVDAGQPTGDGADDGPPRGGAEPSPPAPLAGPFHGATAAHHPGESIRLLVGEEAGSPPSEPAIDLMTIASLLVWSEDAIAALGARRFRLMLELARAAHLLAPEIRDVLRDATEVWQPDDDTEHPSSVSECLLQLRQLEAILDGEQVTRIPRRRAP